MTTPDDAVAAIFAAESDEEEALAIEAALVEQTDNGPQPTDGEPT